MVIGHGTTLRHSDVIYQRASWGWWDGGRILTNREQGPAVGILVDDVIFSDPFPTMNAINFDMRPGSSSGAPHLEPATLQNVTIRNLHVAAFSTQTKCDASCAQSGWCVPACAIGDLPRGVPNRLLGGPDHAANNITSIAFENCTIGGVGLGTLLRNNDPAFNVTWGSVRGITVDGKPVGGSPDAACEAQLEGTCGLGSNPFKSCEVCCGQHQLLLRGAGCSAGDCARFCSATWSGRGSQSGSE